jgi:hypothetical protein
LKEVTKEYQYDTYNYDYSSYETNYEGSYGSDTSGSTAAIESTASASAPQGAESPSVVAPEGTIAHGAETAAVTESNGHSHDGSVADGHAEHVPTIEHSA